MNLQTVQNLQKYAPLAEKFAKGMMAKLPYGNPFFYNKIPSQVMRANSDINNASSITQNQIITLLTGIRQSVIETKFGFEKFTPSNYINIDIKNLGFQSQYYAMTSSVFGGGINDSYITTSQDNFDVKVVDVAFGSKTYPVAFWGRRVNYNTIELNTNVINGLPINFDIVERKEEALRKAYAQEYLRMIFLGIPSVGASGLSTATGVKIYVASDHDNPFASNPISKLPTNDLAEVAGQLMTQFTNNSHSYELPNRLVYPMRIM